MEHIFTIVYETNKWGNNNIKQYTGSSGAGSAINFNRDTYVKFLKKFIIDNNVKQVVDLGCGDFLCGTLLYSDLDISYTGYDVYKKVIDYNGSQFPSPKFTFNHLDFCNEKHNIKSGDLCILKDVLQHWSTKNIYNFLDYLVASKKFKYILICNCCGQKSDRDDINDGNWRQLSSKYLPLKKYNPTILYTYHTKEVSVIEIK